MSSSGQSDTNPSSSLSMIAVKRNGCVMLRVHNGSLLTRARLCLLHSQHEHGLMVAGFEPSLHDPVSQMLLLPLITVTFPSTR